MVHRVVFVVMHYVLYFTALPLNNCAESIWSIGCFTGDFSQGVTPSEVALESVRP